MNSRELLPLLGALQSVTDWLQDCAVPGAIVGGVAASLLGRPRLTRDVDALVSAESDKWPALLREAPRFGLSARIADPLVFAARARVLLLRHDPSAIDVDVILGALPLEELIVRNAIGASDIVEEFEKVVERSRD